MQTQENPEPASQQDVEKNASKISENEREAEGATTQIQKLPHNGYSNTLKKSIFTKYQNQNIKEEEANSESDPQSQ